MSERAADVAPVENGHVGFVRLCASEDRVSVRVIVEFRVSGCLKLAVVAGWEQEIVMPGSAPVVAFDESSGFRCFGVVVVVDFDFD